MDCLTLLSKEKSVAESSGIKPIYSRIKLASEIYPYAREGVSLFLIDKSTLKQEETLQQIQHVINTLYYKPLLVYELSEEEERNKEIEALVDGICIVASDNLPTVSDGLLLIVKGSTQFSHPNKFNTVEKTITIASFSNGQKESITLFECKTTPSTENSTFESSGGLDSASEQVFPIAKICGLKTPEAAQVAIDHGATMLGMIMVPGRSRTVGEAEGLAISRLVRQVREGRKQESYDIQSLVKAGDSHFYVKNLKNRKVKGQSHSPGPFLVGVFRNQPLSEVLELQKKYQLDYVQLHGDEPLSWCQSIPVPVIKRFTPGTEQFPECLKSGLHAISLIDSPLGGEGKLVDRSTLKKYAQLGARFVIAGGLTPDNVKEVYDNGVKELQGMIGVDVSGGVESSEGIKDFDKIKRFLESITNK